MKRFLDALERCWPTRMFCVGYAWMDQTFGELKGFTVVDACDEQSALQSLRSKNPHLIRVWIEDRDGHQ